MTPPSSTPSGADLRVMHVMECTIGGTRRHITDVSRGLLARGVELHLVASAERQADFRSTLAELAQAGCQVHELPMKRSMSPLSDARQLLEIQRLLRRVRPDIVHTHSSKAGVLGRLASITSGIGVRVHTPHTLAFLFREMFGPAKRALFHALEKNLAGHTRRLVAVSESEARTFRDSGIVDPGKVRVVTNGIDPAPFRDVAPIDLSACGLDPRRRTAAVVGLLNVAKGQDWAIRALAQPALAEWQLMLAGHGEWRAELESLATGLGVRERVAFLGFRSDVPAILSAADLVWLPSRWEGLPYIVLEALAAAKAVVATPVDGAVDLLEDGTTGWLAASTSCEAFAAKLGQVTTLDPDELSRVGERGRALVLERFTCEAMVDRLLDLYAEVL